ncbi:dual specificity protein phosphatase family protein [candidate division KSB1 bacterium]|nr:dual specificity protein phosphatase family protein [candidate division KSB1 bacterium]
MSEFKIWWLIPGQLGGMPRPLNACDFKEMKDKQVKAVVNLLASFQNQSIYEKSGLEFIWLPMQDMTAPNLKQVLLFKDFVDQKLKEKKPVAVHCFAGQGRTGTMLASWLVLNQTKPKAAIKQVRSANPKAIENQVQEEFLIQLPNMIKSPIMS